MSPKKKKTKAKKKSPAKKKSALKKTKAKKKAKAVVKAEVEEAEIVEEELDDSLVSEDEDDQEVVQELEVQKPEPIVPMQKPKKKKEEPKKKGKWSLFGKKKKQEEPEEEEEEEQQFTLTVKEIKKPTGIGAFLKSLNYMGMGKYRHSFIQSLALMLNAGLPLIDALSALEGEVRAKAMKKLIEKIRMGVKSGTPLWRTMENTYFFTPYEIAMVHIGEDAGNLAKNLGYLAEQQEKDHKLKQKVKMAMIYPTIVLVLVFIIVIGLGMFVLPNLVQVLFSMNVELPMSTRIIIKITNFFETHGMRVVPGSMGAFLLIVLLTKYTRFKVVTQWFIFRIPGIGRLAREATIARFGIISGGLLRAGVPLVEALESLVDVTQVASYKRFYGKLLRHINVGDSFSKSFAAISSTKRMLPVSVQQLIVTGERSGTLSETLLKVSTIYEQKAEETAEKLPVILEPMLLLLIGAIVGGIAFSIITPIYGVVGNVGAG